MTIGGLRKRKGLKDDQHPVNLKLAMEITRRKARRLLDAAADFQSILAALLLLERLPNGRYPNRNPAQAAWLLPMVEAVRQTVITIATDREIDVVTTNSDGSPARRAFLLSRLGPGSVETILDPGIDVVTQRLAGPDGLESWDTARQDASNRSGFGASLPFDISTFPLMVSSYSGWAS